MTPFDKAVEVVVLGRENEMDLLAIEMVDRIICCSVEEGWVQRPPSCIIAEPLTSPTKSIRARWKASRSAIFMLRKLDWPSVRLIGANWSVWGAGRRVPREGKSESRAWYGRLLGGYYRS